MRLRATVATLMTACVMASCTSATGSPVSSPGSIRVGLINQQEGAVTFSAAGDGVSAAVDEIDARGGIGGRRLVLDWCADDGTPATVASCAVRLASDGDVAVIDAVNLSDGPLHAVLDSAGISVIGGYPYTSDDLASRNSYWLFPYDDLLGAALSLMTKVLHAHTVGYLMPDTASAARPAAELARAAARLGVKWSASPYSLTATDFSAPIASLLLRHPDVLLTFATDQSVRHIVAQMRAAGWAGPIVVGTTQAYATVGSSDLTARGVYALSDLYDWYSTAGIPAQDAADIAVYRQAMRTRYPSVALSTFSQGSFANTMDLAEVLQGIRGRITAASVTAALRDDVTRHKFMGTDFNCAEHSLPSDPGNCSAGVQFLWWDGTGWHESGQFLSASTLFG